MNDAALVDGMYDVGDALEKRHVLRQRHPSVLREPGAQGDALYELHCNPPQPPLLFGNAERVDVGHVGMIEL